ncbi:MAG: MauE/DoxX family redox-associated membrane protein [Candidatus Zhuqueibacterota bacterium]
MNRGSVRQIIVTSTTWLVAIIFIGAGGSKIIDPAKFAMDIDNYRLLPYLLVTVAAVVLPWLEVMSGLALIVAKKRGGALLTLAGLSFMFILAMVSALVRGLDISCGCFSIDGEGARIGVLRLIQDVLLFAAILFLYGHHSKTNSER